MTGAKPTTQALRAQIATLRDDFDQWCRSTEFTRETTRPVDAGDQQALRDSHDLMERALTDIAAQDAQTQRLREALEPFKSGEWGHIKAWIVNGAPTRDDGIAFAAQLTRWQVAVDAALATEAPAERPVLREAPLRDND